MAPPSDLSDPPPGSPLSPPSAPQAGPYGRSPAAGGSAPQDRARTAGAAYGAPYSLRAAVPADAESIKALLQRAYGRLLVPDYPADALAAALPELSAAHPNFLSSPTCFVAEGPCGRILGCGGWSEFSPYRTRLIAGLGHIHHIATDPDQIGRGIGAAIFGQVELTARLAGISRLKALVTRSAVGFFRAQGMQALGEVDMRMTPELRLAAEDMRMDLAQI